MNALLLQLLTSRLSSSGDPKFAEIIAQMSGGSAVSSQDLLARLGAQNPAVAQLLATMKAQSESRPVVLEGDSISHTRNNVASAQGGTALKAGESSPVDDQDSELNWLRDHNDLIASALGACSKCWGREQACALCNGAGRPGCFLPDEDLFREFVAPAVRALRASKEEQRASVTPAR